MAVPKSDAQKFITELLLVNSLGFVGSLSFDMWPNFFHAMGFTAIAHPYHWGILQIVGTLFFGAMLFRAHHYSKYYF